MVAPHRGGPARGSPRTGLTQEDVAERLGKPQSFVSEVESGERGLDILGLRDLRAVLGSTLPDFAKRLATFLIAGAEAGSRGTCPHGAWLLALRPLLGQQVHDEPEAESHRQKADGDQSCGEHRRRSLRDAHDEDDGRHPSEQEHRRRAVREPSRSPQPRLDGAARHQGHEQGDSQPPRHAASVIRTRPRVKADTRSQPVRAYRIHAQLRDRGGSTGWIRTTDLAIMSRLLCH